MLTFITHMWSSVVSINVTMLCMGQSQLLANSQVFLSQIPLSQAYMKGHTSNIYKVSTETTIKLQ